MRPKIRGKFLFVGEEKFYVRGVTYGAFRPDEEKREYQDLAVIDRDFAQMAANGINTVRNPAHDAAAFALGHRGHGTASR